ncbi:MAG: tRNA preQ1(34) S-adenosylmethionine ribosyltransferase-isomerase QueA [Patescibacteria group bacterium]
MRLEEFNYFLPKNLIAQKPVKPRDRSRLLLLSKEIGKMEHKNFYDIVDYLQKGDVLVLNNSKVMPARLLGKKKITGGKIEVFLLKKNPLTPFSKGGENWQCLIGGRGARPFLEIEFKEKLECRIIKNNQDGTWEVEFNKIGREFMNKVEKVGLMPLPPYIKRGVKEKSDTANYQTVYADEKKVGSVAAPTAGLHFTPGLLKKLKRKGVYIKYITLHVGLGTFAPVKADDIEKHKMHAEWIEADKKIIADICLAKSKGKRIIAVGTTSARTLETIFSKFSNKKTSHRISDFKLNGWTDIFIYPGYKFKIVDALITNFHLPKSTLLMLVSALAGKKNIAKAYQEAVRRGYRFYSYGDAMFIY